MSKILAYLKTHSVFTAILGVLIFLTIIVYIIFHQKSEIALLKAQVQVSVQNYKAASDSARTLLTANGSLTYEYAYVLSLSDSLKNVAYYKDKTIYALQNTVADLQVKLKQNVINVVASSDSNVGAVFHNTYKDGGLTANLTDSVNFKKVKDSLWTASNNPSFSAFIVLQNTLGRNPDGSFYGAVESFSPLLTITSVKTVIDDKYVPALTVKVPTTFGVGGSLDQYSGAIGIYTKPNKLLYGIEYQVFMKNAPDNLTWYNHLRGTIACFIW